MTPEPKAPASDLDAAVGRVDALRVRLLNRDEGMFPVGAVEADQTAIDLRLILSALSSQSQAAEGMAYWRRGHEIIECRLAKASAAKHEDAPFPLDAEQAALWHAAQVDAYRDALEMMGVPETLRTLGDRHVD